MVKERLGIVLDENHDLEIYDVGTGHKVGLVAVEIIEGNVVITVTREDEAKFGPVSLVVV